MSGITLAMLVIVIIAIIVSIIFGIFSFIKYGKTGKKKFLFLGIILTFVVPGIVLYIVLRTYIFSTAIVYMPGPGTNIVYMPGPA